MKNIGYIIASLWFLLSIGTLLAGVFGLRTDPYLGDVVLFGLLGLLQWEVTGYRAQDQGW